MFILLKQERTSFRWSLLLQIFQTCKSDQHYWMSLLLSLLLVANVILVFIVEGFVRLSNLPYGVIRLISLGNGIVSRTW